MCRSSISSRFLYCIASHHLSRRIRLLCDSLWSSVFLTVYLSSLPLICRSLPHSFDLPQHASITSSHHLIITNQFYRCRSSCHASQRRHTMCSTHACSMQPAVHTFSIPSFRFPLAAARTAQLHPRFFPTSSHFPFFHGIYCPTRRFWRSVFSVSLSVQSSVL